MTDLVILSDYKEYKNIQSSTRDGKIQALITSISSLIENYCNRKFIDYSSSPGVTEWFDGNTNLVYLREFPVITVDSVMTSIDGGLTQTTLTENDTAYGGYYVDLIEGTVRTQRTIDKFVTDYATPYRSLEVTYTAGYTANSLPEDLKLAIMDTVAYYLDDENKPTKALLGATIDNPLPSLAQNFPPHIKRILDLYRYSPGF